jgi:hypothetical protein
MVIVVVGDSDSVPAAVGCTVDVMMNGVDRLSNESPAISRHFNFKIFEIFYVGVCMSVGYSSSRAHFPAVLI